MLRQRDRRRAACTALATRGWLKFIGTLQDGRDHFQRHVIQLNPSSAAEISRDIAHKEMSTVKRDCPVSLQLNVSTKLHEITRVSRTLIELLLRFEIIDFRRGYFHAPKREFAEEPPRRDRRIWSCRRRRITPLKIH